MHKNPIKMSLAKTILLKTILIHQNPSLCLDTMVHSLHLDNSRISRTMSSKKKRGSVVGEPGVYWPLKSSNTRATVQQDLGLSKLVNKIITLRILDKPMKYSAITNHFYLSPQDDSDVGIEIITFQWCKHQCKINLRIYN